jgi:hypothetical protein
MVGGPRAPGADELAMRLHTAQARLAASDLPQEIRSRLQRHLIAVCDAVKAPGTDPGGCGRRLDGFLAALDAAIAGK